MKGDTGNQAGNLGITVTTPDTFSHVLGLTKAAVKAGKQVRLFFTGQGVHQTQAPAFPQLLKLGKVGVCEASFISRGYHKADLPNLKDKDFVTQAYNAEMVENTDRYLVF